MGEVVLKKDSEKGPTLSFVRDDGSVVWRKTGGFFVRHDLLHYAVESELGLSQGFIGLMIKGWSFEDFEEKQPATGRVRPVPADATRAETTVGALGLWKWSSPDADPIETLKLAGCDTTGVDANAVERIFARYEVLISGWNALAEGDSMSLPWPAAT